MGAPEHAPSAGPDGAAVRPPRVVAFGGGHGLAAALAAWRRITPDLTAVVTVADDGGGVAPGAETASVGLGFARKLLAHIGYSLLLCSAPGRTLWTIARSGAADASGP